MAAKKNKEINTNDLVTIKPITDNQKLVFSTWKKGLNQFLFGAELLMTELKNYKT